MEKSETSFSNSRGIFQLAGPLVISFWMRAAFTFVDTIYASFLGDSAVAAIGLTFPFEFFWIACWVGSSTGLTACLSRALGAEQEAQWRQYMKIGKIMVAILVPVFFCIGIGIYFLAPLMNLAPDLERDFQIYGTVLIAGSALTSFWSVLPDSMIKAYQDTKTTMWAGIIANIINLVLNTFFLFVLHWGIFGIALSTVLGRIGSFGYALWKVRSHERKRLASTTKWQCELDPFPAKSILRLAFPSALTFALMATEPAILNFLFAKSENPTEAMAAYSIYYRVVLLALQPLIAVGVAALPFTGRHFGNRNFRAIEEALKKIALASLAYSLILLPIFWFLGPWLGAKLSDSPVTQTYSIFCLKLVPWVCLLGGPFLVIRPIFEGMQKGFPGLIMATLKFIVLTPPAVYLGGIFAERYGFDGFYGMILALLLVGFLSSTSFLVWLLRDLKKLSLQGT